MTFFKTISCGIEPSNSSSFLAISEEFATSDDATCGYLSLFGLEGLSRRYGVYSEGVGVYLEARPIFNSPFSASARPRIPRLQILIIGSNQRLKKAHLHIRYEVSLVRRLCLAQ